LNIWQDGIQDNLITALSNSSDLKVRHKESVNWLIQNESPASYASMAPSIAKLISKKLEVDIFISGTINQAGAINRINAQLIDSHTDEVYKSFQIDGAQREILYSVDSLCSMVMNYLVISKLIGELPPYLQHRPLTDSPEAYSYYLQGENARSKRDYPLARKMYAQALSIDSNYHHMKLLLSVACVNQGLYEEARIWHDRAYEKIDQMPIRLKILTNSNHSSFYETPAERIKYLEQFLEIDDKFPGTYYDIGLNYSGMLQYEKAIPYFEKALEIYDKMNLKPWWIYNYTELGYAYHQTGQHRKEEKLYKKADKDFPEETSLVWRKAILYLTIGDTDRADELLKQYREIYKENSFSESALERNLGWAYTQAGMPDKAEESFRRSVSLDRKDPAWIYYLAYYLIDQDRNVNEGLELIEKAIEMSRGQYEYIFFDCKGWGLYKQGKYDEALEILQKGWDLRRAKAGYDHKAFLHLEAARKALAEQS
jgi:tetratricopeptide (TPR) repeat protein